MTDKSAPALSEVTPLSKLLAIGTRASILAKVLDRGDLTASTVRDAMVTMTGLLIDLTSVVVKVYGDQQMAMQRSAEATGP